eukprot:CAMPEP_0181302788 /NCGR_PEP_ID=MMETSP1101-20121128/8190_1 /TAXON_ID=46948 /ORGANISM="Rhodomonas abbreviata, Strain Caron Lab Isolate" /LENGTH=384 /DNA_ID=CAMNT_0023408275 /DNA_START=269 /DNA_END=1423 /DNA_ORIENTATION=-
MSVMRQRFGSILGVARRSWPALSRQKLSGSPIPFPQNKRKSLELTLSRKKTQPDSANQIIVPWFPMSKADLDELGTHSLEYGAELDSDHPGFLDIDYRSRRRKIVEQGTRYKYADGAPIQDVEYSDSENATWSFIYDHLKQGASRYAVRAFNEIQDDMEREGIYRRDRIPQLQNVSNFLSSRTGFTLRPVSGLLSARDFLNALALKVFFSTQYIRHPSRPLYTPEPDVVHELIGHAPMLADPDFAALSHEIGLASLGASDEEIERLATAYWFSVEFGLCHEDGRLKAYGAGVLSSVEEMLHGCSPPPLAPPTYRPWDPSLASLQPYPITSLQPLYFVADSLASAKGKMRDYTQRMDRGFDATFDAAKGRIVTSPSVHRLPLPAS